MGTDAHLKIVLKNQSQEPRKATLHSQVAVMYYTGVLKDTVKTEKLPVYLKPNEGDLKRVHYHESSLDLVDYLSITASPHVFYCIYTTTDTKEIKMG